MRRTSWLWVLSSFIALAAAGGCGGGCWGGEADGDRGPDAGGADATLGAADDGRTAAPLRADRLEPSFSAVGARGHVPDRLVVTFGRAIASSGQVSPGSATEFDIEPGIDGELRFTSNSTLAFVPDGHFKPSTTYQFTLRSLEVRPPGESTGADAGETRVLTPETPWKHEFETPDFQLVEVSPATSTGGAGTARAHLTFSAPVDPDAISGYVDWQVGGRPLPDVDYTGANSANVVRADLRHRALADPDSAGELTFVLEEGFPYDETITAPAKTETVDLQQGPPVAIRDIVLKEGQNGFYLHVICDDEASTDDRYWDQERRESYDTSERCEPDAEIADEFIEVSPELETRISPAEGGFRILADFERRSYSVRLATGLTTVDGGVLRDSYENVFDVPARSPIVDISATGRYIPRSMWQHLPVRHRNVQNVDLRVRHVPRENMVFWMTGGDDNAGERTSNVVVDATVSVQGAPDETTTTWLDVQKFVGEPEMGVYQIEISAGDKTSIVRLSVTDMNVIVKRAAAPPGAAWSRTVRAWARDIETNEPLSNVDMEVIRKSGDVLARCETGADGGCRLSLPEKKVDPSEPFAIIARRGDDITFLEYDDLESNVQHANLHGEPYQSEKPYRGSLYTERGVYRPGETAHVVGVVRKENHRAPKPEMPVELKVRDARGRLVRKVVRKTNRAGVVELDESFGDLAETGQWRVEMAVADNDVASHEFNVEEFVPERMDVEASVRSEHLAFEDRAQVKVDAEYLFGASAEGSDVDLDCRVEPADFEPPKNADLEYGPIKLDGNYDSITLETVRGTIGENGSTTLSCPSIDRASAFPTTGRLVANVDVYESGSGRTTRARATARVHPERHYIGLRQHIEEVQAGETYRMEGRVVDWQGQPVSSVDEIEVQFSDLEGEWTRFYNSELGRTDWKKHLRPVREGRQTVSVADDGSFEIEFTPGSVDDGYLLRATAGEAETAVQFDPERRYYRHRSPRETRNRTPRPDTPDALHVDVPEPISVGEEHTATFTAAYKGRVLLTVETDGLVRHEWREVDAGKHEWSFELDEFAPNVYVGAFLMKDPHLESDDAYLPGRAFGMQSARVEPEQFTASVDVSVPEKVEPNSTLSVDVETDATDGPAWVAVAAVDEGILSLTDFETPDPLREILAKRTLGVTTFDTIGWALSFPPRGQSAAQGGGAGSDGKGRIMPVEPVALWSGLQKISSGGTQTVELDVPQYRGELRVMTHVFSANRIGRDTTSVEVHDPMPLQATTPRFLTAEDEVQIPVFVTNMTDRDRTVSVELGAETIERGSTGQRAGPALEVQNESTQSVQVDREASETVVFEARAERLAGAARISVTASSGSLKSATDKVVPFRASGPREKRAQQLEISRGTTDLSDAVDGWKPTSEETSFWLTSIEDGKSFDKAKRLIRYPYGCVEQTTSTTRPLLFVSELLEAADPSMLSRNESVDEMVQHGIDRVLSMQTPSGGIGYWPGAREPHPWGTTFATHMLLDAREQGYRLPDRRLESALDWLESYANGKSGDRDDYYTHLGTNGEAYMHYVLARSGRGQKAAILDLIDDLSAAPTGKERETAYLLKAAVHQTGDHRYKDDLRSPTVGDSMGDRETGRSFYSDARRRGFVLNIFQELFGDDSAAEPLARQVAEALDRRESSWYSTQELVWGVTGLGKWYRNRASDAFESASLAAGGTEIEPTTDAGAVGTAWDLPRASEYDDLAIEVEGGEAEQLYLVVSSEGVRRNPSPRWGGEGLEVERRYKNRSGDRVSFENHGIGDVTYTEITLTNTSGEDLRNVALVDRFPAGWEVENPRLGGTNQPDWVEDRWSVDHMNVRDDRVEFFGDIDDDESVTIVYASRATLAGEFDTPPVRAEAMYDPEVWAQQRGRRVTVGGPWSEFID